MIRDKKNADDNVDVFNRNVDVVEKQWGAYLIACGFVGGLLIIATWRLWVPQQAFPQVPLVRTLPFVGEPRQWPDGAQWTGLCLLALGICSFVANGIILNVFSTWGSSISRSEVRIGWLRRAVLLWCLGWVLLVLVDQHRMQPWALQLFVIAVLSATMQPLAATRIARWFILGIYFWSALSKLDVQFARTVGTQFVDHGISILHLKGGQIDRDLAAKLAMVFPIGEMLLVGLLLFARTRRIGVCAAVCMHGTLLVLLGPLGLGHEPGVLLWNVLFLVQACILFWPDSRTPVRKTATKSQPRTSRSTFTWIGPALVSVMLVIPVAERWGYVDHWFSWALYAPHSSRAILYIHNNDRDRLPIELRELIEDNTSERHSKTLQPWDWVRVPIEQWSLESLGAPIYPQARFQLGVAISVANQSGLDRDLRVELLSAADRWTGERETQTFIGVTELHRASKQFWLNSLPKE